MKLSVIIVNYNVKHFLQLCLHSVLRAIRHLDAEIIVVDNQSGDNSVDMVRECFPEVVLIANQQNLGFSKANNQAVAIAKGEYILFLNPDTVMPEDFFEELLPYMDANPQAGAIGPRLIDGKGQFAPDGKKGFPTLWVAIYKASGLNWLFPKSPKFNRYYAVHVGEYETAAVDVLSGCCMMVRAGILKQIGGAFDEDFFMYCEDTDLCYRIQQAGYQNIYFPKTTLIHYKGESTRKATISYVRIFNQALATFVRKHYGQQHARLFLAFIQVGIFMRAVISVLKGLFQMLRMPLFDALVLFLVLWVMKGFWVEQVKDVLPIPLRDVMLTFPAFVAIWVGSMFLNGAYDQPYRGLRVIRGMGIGTVIVLAYYGLLPVELRHSRAMLLFSGAGGALLLIAAHELLSRLGIIKLSPQHALSRKAVIVAADTIFQQTKNLLERVHYAPEILGRIEPLGNAPASQPTLASMQDMKSLLRAAGADEVIFCVNGLSYQQILWQMQHCGSAFDYKIHLPDSLGFVGSNSSFTAGDLYALEQHYAIGRFAQQRNKRMVDLTMALLMLLCSPVVWWLLHERRHFLSNVLLVLSGKNTWVGYVPQDAAALKLPALKTSVLPPWRLQHGFDPNDEARKQMIYHYARSYHPSGDISLILKNLRFLGKKPEKYLAEKSR